MPASRIICTAQLCSHGRLRIRKEHKYELIIRDGLKKVENSTWQWEEGQFLDYIFNPFFESAFGRIFNGLVREVLARSLILV